MKKQIILLTALTSFVSFAQDLQPSTPVPLSPTVATIAPIPTVPVSEPTIKTVKPIAKVTSIRMEIEDGYYIVNGQVVSESIKNCKLPKNSPVFIVHSRIVNAEKITIKILNSNGEVLATNNGLLGLCSFIDHASSLSKLENSAVKQ